MMLRRLCDWLRNGEESGGLNRLCHALFIHKRGQFASLIHFHHDVGAAQKLTFYIELRDGGANRNNP